jgi:hypothetical protein
VEAQHGLSERVSYEVSKMSLPALMFNALNHATRGFVICRV